MKNLLQKYKPLLSYIFWGVATTAVNYCVYFLCTRLLSIHYLASNIGAWVVAVIFAFTVNKLFVFQSTSWKPAVAFGELWKFISARILSGALETGLLFLFVDCLHFNDSIIKILAGFIVIALNYAISKWLIFKK